MMQSVRDRQSPDGRRPRNLTPNLAALGEFGLIGRIQNLANRKNPSVLIGIGDDAAAVKTTAGKITLVTTDLLLQGIHFNLAYVDYFSLGWKAAAVNLSDIAAMGAVPVCCLTALGLPRTISEEQILDFYRGFNTVLRVHKAILAGGDTCASRNELFISVTAMGQAELRNILTRAGARPGDRIFVTGTLGDSAAGLEILQSDRTMRTGGERTKETVSKKLVQRHLRPEPRIREGRLLARYASAMIDVSDGLSSDLFHICEQSGVGAVIRQDHVPVSRALSRYAVLRKKSLTNYTLSGGEDYELLFTVPEARLKRFRAININATEIGIVTKKAGMVLIQEDGTKSELKPKGYDHFAPIRRF